MNRLRRTWSRRPRITLGQTMGVVVAVSLLLALFVPRAGPDLGERCRAFLDVLLVLPFAVTLILILTSRTPLQRHTLGRFLAAGPVLFAAILYFHTTLLGALALQELPRPANRAFAPNRPGLAARLAYLGAFPLAYLALVVVLLPRRCPHCRERALERWAAPPGSPAAEAAEVFRCDDCGARCWRSSPADAWEVDPSPLEGERDWYDAFAPKLRELRRQMRPN